MGQWSIPALQYEEHTWHIDSTAPISRSRRSRGNGLYQSAIPIKLQSLELSVPVELSTLIEEAASALTQFDTYAVNMLGSNVRSLGPMSAILLRTEATSSSQIEHLTVGAKNLALEMLDEGNSENAAIVIGNVRAMEAALRLADTLNRDHLLAMHNALLSTQSGWEQYAGTFRNQLVWVGTDSYSPRGASFIAPQPEYIDAAITDVFDFLNRDDISVIVQCAFAHAQFETIHPFVDGNGRTGRALIHAVLRNKGLTEHVVPPVSAGLLRQTHQYFDALTTFRSGDAAPLVEIFADACIFAAQSGIELIDQLSAQLESTKVLLHGMRRDAAVWKVVPYLLAQPIMNTQYVRSELGLSKSQAERALKTLAQVGALEPRNSAKRNVVWEHRGILNVLDQYAASLRRA